MRPWVGEGNIRMGDGAQILRIDGVQSPAMVAMVRRQVCQNREKHARAYQLLAGSALPFGMAGRSRVIQGMHVDTLSSLGKSGPPSGRSEANYFYKGL